MENKNDFVILQFDNTKVLMNIECLTKKRDSIVCVRNFERFATKEDERKYNTIKVVDEKEIVKFDPHFRYRNPDGSVRWQSFENDHLLDDYH